MNEYRVVANALEHTHDEVVHTVTTQMKSRGVRAANELRNASQLVLRGQRSGRKYIVPGTGSMKYNKKTKTAKITYKRYTASAPGEPPAVRTGMFRMSWTQGAKSYATQVGDTTRIHSTIESNIKVKNGRNLGDLLENGGGKIKPRPYKKAIIEKAKPAILKIYQEPYI